ncbi:hypothetical protein BJ742DRAFT_291382 [Cladochytrium replicatum]|nr:hypothetical protein BJ742DRAFT_291382 [Cladochytrium replicatum]
MGLYSASQARAAAASQAPPAAAPYGQPGAPSQQNQYIPPKPEQQYVPPPYNPANLQAPLPAAAAPAPIPAPIYAPPPPMAQAPTKGGLGRLFSKKAAPAPPPTFTGPPAGATSPVGNSRDWFDAIVQRLHSTVESNKLHKFYALQEIQNIALRVWNTVNVGQLAIRWNVPRELALDLISLALYDIVLYGDDSGSMRSEGGGRIDDLKFIVTKVTEIAVLFDTDGISVRFINSPSQLDNCTNPNQVSDLFAKVEFKYGTPLGTKLEEKILRPQVYDPANGGRMKKPVLVITITDGEPTNESDGMVVKVIASAKKRLDKTKYGGGAVAFQFAQVGTDLTAQAFLKMLDDHSEVGKLVDCTSAFELEQEECIRKGVELSPEMWLVKVRSLQSNKHSGFNTSQLMCGAIDSQYDNQD